MMTVSHVVNGTKNVREDTRAAVLAAVEELGYLPNAAARALASATTTRIGLVYQNAQNAFLSAVLVGTLNAASRLGAQVIIRKCDAPTMTEATSAIRALVRSGANAILLAPPYCELVSGSPMAVELQVPLAAIAYGDPLPDMVSFGIDDVAAAREMTAMLIEGGHRRIGFVTGPASHAASAARLAGYRETLAAHGIDSDPALIRVGDFTFESGLPAAAALLDLPVPPSAVFASNDDMAAAVNSVAHRRGLRVPADLAICGFDDAPIAVKIWPPLTTVRHRVDLMAEHATEALIATLHGAPLGSDRRFNYAVIVRESTGLAAPVDGRR